MSRRHPEPPVPKRALMAIGALVLATFALTGSVALGLLDRPKPASVQRVEQGIPVVAARRLVFLDRPDGALVIAEPGAPGVVQVIAPGTHQGFVRGVIRSMARERRLRELGPELPYRLMLWGDGRLSLLDEATGRVVELDSFGRDNRAAFRALLPMPPEESS
ncbi:MAG: photosynthetic complex assembly protein PuhC [Sphingomonadaceae bacterium]|uniref:photosynthetic complex assembly protein PuhC n=1 Tax=Thermaurantiacus sp. TaxID=2820283 RepID=UPI00298F0F83|nr:photosynthetic complex assembly protein PuhC [Thermaurantiacus sp.]MCS6987808.1 photosynthetic complex assembly protein PuhC [Sphingomonadaceae bacterium]MDW8414972.1 photosynthetic complex assembly protein PuhC [Thermaurantiacus sp.]